MKKLICTLVILAFAVSLNAQWEQYSNGIMSNNVNCFAENGSYVFAGTQANGFFRTSNHGTNWFQTSLNTLSVTSILTLGNIIYAGTESNGIWGSPDNGLNFAQLTTIGGGVSLAHSGNTLFSGSQQGVHYSTNGGSLWILTALNNQYVRCITTNDSLIIAGTDTAGIFISTNFGLSWTQKFVIQRKIRTVAMNGTTVFAGTNNGLYKSLTNGNTWTLTTLNNQQINYIYPGGNNILAGTFLGGVYLSTNNGDSWTQRNEGFTTLYSIKSFLVENNNIFAGTEISSVWRRPLSDFVGIQNISTEIPSSYSLSQNYPNPFNPSTVVRFQLSVAGLTTLKVFDMMGKEVQTLVNERLQAGTYETTFDGSNLSSGMYFYRLQTDGYTETRKMTLLK
jgi:Secretion system C-terminal sorting domain